MVRALLDRGAAINQIKVQWRMSQAGHCGLVTMVLLLMLSVLGDVVQDEVYLVTEGVGGGVVIGVCVVRM